MLCGRAPNNTVVYVGCCPGDSRDRIAVWLHCASCRIIIEAAVVIIENDATDKTDSEEEQRNSRILCNRIIVCLFALCLLWITSLQVALSIIDIYVSTPRLDSVITGCRHSYDIVVSHKKAFGDCVDRQLIQCNRNLDKSYALEKDKKAGYETANAAFLLSLQRRYTKEFFG